MVMRLFCILPKCHCPNDSRAKLRSKSTEPDVQGMLMTLLTWPFSKSGTVMLAKPDASDLRELIRLYEAGQLKVTIDSRFDFAHTADAHRRIEAGVDHGKVEILRTFPDRDLLNRKLVFN
jgi:hypothetical protein